MINIILADLKTEDIAALFNHIVNDYSGWAKAISPDVLDCPHKPELTEFLIECFEETNPSIALAFAMATFKKDCREKLKELSVPSLTLAMANDPLVPLHIGEYIREYTPNNFLVVMKATGHFPQICEPEETVKEIKKFIMDEHMC